MAPSVPSLRRRSPVFGDLRIILLGTWAFLLQILRSWRLTPQLLAANDDEHQP